MATSTLRWHRRPLGRKADDPVGKCEFCSEGYPRQCPKCGGLLHGEIEDDEIREQCGSCGRKRESRGKKNDRTAEAT